MGRPKLMLPLGETTVIARVLQALAASGVAATYVLVRADDQALIDEVQKHSGRAVITPEATRDMRQSVQKLLDAIVDESFPQETDGWLLCPADHPLLDSEIVSALLREFAANPTGIVVPSRHGRRGHPTVFSWPLAREVERIPADQGVNWMLRQFSGHVRQVDVDSTDIFVDLDTPDDYERLKKRCGS